MATRKTKEHKLPEHYDGRCVGTLKKDFVASFPSYGRIKDLAADEVLHKWEMRLPIPTGKFSKELKGSVDALYGMSQSEFMDKSLDKLKTDLDELFKSFLFGQVIRTEEGELAVLKAKKDGSPGDMPEGAQEVYPVISHPSDAGGSYDEGRHIVAQEAVDNWRYVAPAAGRSMTVQAVIDIIVSSGKATAEDFEGVEDTVQLQNRCIELGFNIS